MLLTGDGIPEQLSKLKSHIDVKQFAIVFRLWCVCVRARLFLLDTFFFYKFLVVVVLI